MRRSWSGFISKATLLRLNQNGSCLSHDPPSEENKICTGSYFVPRTVWAVFGWGKRGRGNRHKWSNYLGMRSLFGSISSRLWPRETQPSSTTACVISSLRPPHCILQGHFSASSAEGHFVRQLALSSTIQVIGCLLPVIRSSFWMCQLKETYDVCTCWEQLRSTSLMLTSLAAPLLLSGACVSVAFGGNCFLYFNFIWECALNNQRVFGTWGPACFTGIWLTAIADENVLFQYYIAVEVEVSFPGRAFLKAPNVSS